MIGKLLPTLQPAIKQLTGRRNRNVQNRQLVPTSFVFKSTPLSDRPIESEIGP